MVGAFTQSYIKNGGNKIQLYKTILIYHDLGNMIHFSIFTMQIFPPGQKIMIPKYNAVSYSKTETFFLLLLKTISQACQ